MNASQFYLRDAISAIAVRECTALIFAQLGPMLACAWPERDSWLDEIVPELTADQPEQVFPEYQLTQRERKRLLTPELDTIYPVSNEALLARLVLAAIRHSELGIVFAPQHVSRGHLVSLLRLAERYAFRPVDLQKPLRAVWLLDVGRYEVDDKVIRFFTDQPGLQSTLADLLSPLCSERHPL